ncbi:MAG: DUF222 domain-containing protein [Myxococcales bacterium]|nr:DUF222 domain-containing protein [Myxococcales bacterium]
MFESPATQEFQSQLADAYAVTCRERDWIKLHEEITSIGKQIVCLEAREVELLLEAEETKLYRRMGFPTIYAYIEGVLQHSHHVATERMRVAHELLELPGIAEQFRAGELAWTSVRELTRVATGKTEDAWLEAAEGKLSTEVQQLVRGKSKGDLPTDPVDPKKIRHRIVLDGISQEGMMLFKQARNAAADANGASCTDDELVRALAAAMLEPAAGDPGKPRHQIATTTCRACKQSHRVGAGMEIAVSPAELERVRCDSEDIGDPRAGGTRAEVAEVDPDGHAPQGVRARQVSMHRAGVSLHAVPGGAPHQAPIRGWRSPRTEGTEGRSVPAGLAAFSDNRTDQQTATEGRR